MSIPNIDTNRLRESLGKAPNYELTDLDLKEGYARGFVKLEDISSTVTSAHKYIPDKEPEFVDIDTSYVIDATRELEGVAAYKHLGKYIQQQKENNEFALPVSWDDKQFMNMEYMIGWIADNTLVKTADQQSRKMSSDQWLAIRDMFSDERMFEKWDIDNSEERSRMNNIKHNIKRLFSRSDERGPPSPPMARWRKRLEEGLQMDSTEYLFPWDLATRGQNDIKLADLIAEGSEMVTRDLTKAAKSVFNMMVGDPKGAQQQLDAMSVTAMERLAEAALLRQIKAGNQTRFEEDMARGWSAHFTMDDGDSEELFAADMRILKRGFRGFELEDRNWAQEGMIDDDRAENLKMLYTAFLEAENRMRQRVLAKFDKEALIAEAQSNITKAYMLANQTDPDFTVDQDVLESLFTEEAIGREISNLVQVKEESTRIADEVFDIKEEPNRLSYDYILNEARRVQRQREMIEEWQLYQLNIPAQKEDYIITRAKSLLDIDVKSSEDLIKYGQSIQYNSTMHNKTKAMQLKIVTKILKTAETFVTGSANSSKAGQISLHNFRTSLTNPIKILRNPSETLFSVWALDSGQLARFVNGDQSTIQQFTETFSILNELFVANWRNQTADKTGYPGIMMEDIVGIDPDTGLPKGQSNIFTTIELEGGEIVTTVHDTAITLAYMNTLMDAYHQTPTKDLPQVVRSIAGFMKDSYLDFATKRDAVDALQKINPEAAAEMKTKIITNLALTSAIIARVNADPRLKRALMSSLKLNTIDWNNLEVMSLAYLTQGAGDVDNPTYYTPTQLLQGLRVDPKTGVARLSANTVWNDVGENEQHLAAVTSLAMEGFSKTNIEAQNAVFHIKHTVNFPKDEGTIWADRTDGEGMPLLSDSGKDFGSIIRAWENLNVPILKMNNTVARNEALLLSGIGSAESGAYDPPTEFANWSAGQWDDVYESVYLRFHKKIPQDHIKYLLGPDDWHVQMKWYGSGVGGPRDQRTSRNKPDRGTPLGTTTRSHVFIAMVLQALASDPDTMNEMRAAYNAESLFLENSDRKDKTLKAARLFNAANGFISRKNLFIEQEKERNHNINGTTPVGKSTVNNNRSVDDYTNSVMAASDPTNYAGGGGIPSIIAMSILGMQQEGVIKPEDDKMIYGVPASVLRAQQEYTNRDLVVKDQEITNMIPSWVVFREDSFNNLIGTVKDDPDWWHAKKTIGDLMTALVANGWVTATDEFWDNMEPIDGVSEDMMMIEDSPQMKSLLDNMEVEGGSIDNAGEMFANYIKDMPVDRFEGITGTLVNKNVDPQTGVTTPLQSLFGKIFGFEAVSNYPEGVPRYGEGGDEFGEQGRDRRLLNQRISNRVYPDMEELDIPHGEWVVRLPNVRPYISRIKNKYSDIMYIEKDPEEGEYVTLRGRDAEYAWAAKRKHQYGDSGHWSVHDPSKGTTKEKIDKQNEASWFWNWHAGQIESKGNAMSKAHYYYGQNPEIINTMLRRNLKIDPVRKDDLGRFHSKEYMSVILDLGLKTEEWNAAVDLLTSDLSNDLQRVTLAGIKHRSRASSSPFQGGAYWTAGSMATEQSIIDNLPSVGEMHLYVLHEILKSRLGYYDESPESNKLGDIIKSHKGRRQYLGHKWQIFLNELDGGQKRNIDTSLGERVFTTYSHNIFKPVEYRLEDETTNLGKMTFSFRSNHDRGFTKRIPLTLPWTFDDQYYPTNLDTGFDEAFSRGSIFLDVMKENALGVGYYR